MRVMTVRQPWALHIIQSGKDVENRVRNIAGSYRGPVAIHAGLAADDEALRRLPMHAPDGGVRVFDTGVILGVVDVVDVHADRECVGPWRPADHSAAAATRDPQLTALAEESARFGQLLCSPWAQPGTQHLVLSNPRALAKRIPFRGALGMRELDPNVVAEIERVGFVHHERFVEHHWKEQA